MQKQLLSGVFRIMLPLHAIATGILRKGEVEKLIQDMFSYATVSWEALQHSTIAKWKGVERQSHVECWTWN